MATHTLLKVLLKVLLLLALLVLSIDGSSEVEERVGTASGGRNGTIGETTTTVGTFNVDEW